MKKSTFKLPTYLVVILASGLLMVQSCKTAPDYKVVRQEVMDLHDKVMADGEDAVRNKMLLDTLSRIKLPAIKTAQPALDTALEQRKIAALVAKLTKADDEMMDWMHAFQPDTEGKSNEQAVSYFRAEMVKISALEKSYARALQESDAYLKKFDMKPNGHAATDDHSKHGH